MTPALTEDPAEVFAVYLQQGANAQRTALTLKIPVSRVEDLVKLHRWDVKVKEYTGGIENPTLEDFQRGQRGLNRAVNYIQAHRLRDLVDRIVRKLNDQDTLEEYTTIRTKDGFRRDLKPIRELAEAARTAQELSYRALGDSMDVSVTDDQTAAKDGKDLQLALIQAMDAADRNPKTSSTELVRASVREREKKAQTESKTGS